MTTSGRSTWCSAQRK